MPTSILKTTRFSFDLDGNITGSAAVPANGVLYRTDGYAFAAGVFTSADDIPNTGYTFGSIRPGASTTYPQYLMNVQGPTIEFYEYDSTLPVGLSPLDLAREFAFYAPPGGPGGYRLYNLRNPKNIPFDFQFVFYRDYTANNGLGDYQLIGNSISGAYTIRDFKITNFRLEKYRVDTQSKEPLVKILGDITVYPNWQPPNDIHYRLRFKNPSLPYGDIVIDGTIPSSEIHFPDSNGVVASFEAVWDGRLTGLDEFCELMLEVEMLAITEVEDNTNIITPLAGDRFFLIGCRGKKFNGESGFTEDLSIHKGSSDLQTQLSYSSFSNSELPASMGYGWSSTDNIKVYELEDDSLVYLNEAGMSLRWLKSGIGSYEPLMPDNILTISKNTSSATARYVVLWRDQTRREFDDVGNLRKHVDRNGRIINYERSANYFKVTDQEGRSVYRHYLGGATQPSVINDNVDPNQGRRYVLAYYGVSDPAPGRLKSITDPIGDQTLYVYNSAGRLTERREVRPTEGNRSVFYTYANNATGRLTSVRVSSTKFDPQTQQNVVTDLYRVFYSYGVMVNGYITTQFRTRDLMNPTNPDRFHNLAYDYKSRTIAEFDYFADDENDESIYLETYHEYQDPNDPFLLTKTTAPNGAITQWEYTSRGNLKKMTDAQGNESILSYVEEDPLHPAYATFPDLVTEIQRPAYDRFDTVGTTYPTTP